MSALGRVHCTLYFVLPPSTPCFYFSGASAQRTPFQLYFSRAQLPSPAAVQNHSLRMFGVGVPSANAQQHLDSYDSSLRAILVKSGLYDVHCLDPVHGVLKMLSSLSIVSPSNLIYTTPEFAEKVEAGVPDTAAVRAFVLMHSVGAFTWTNMADANQVKIDQSLVIGRFCMVVHYALDSARQSVANIMEEEQPLSVAQHESCEGRYQQIYSEVPDASQLGSLILLGKLSRGLATRTFPAIPLASVFDQTDDRAKSEDSHLDVNTMKVRKKQKFTRIPTPAIFIEKLEVFMASLVFVCVLAPAPHPEWSGDPDDGLIKGVRIQATRQGVAPYLAFWKEQVRNTSASVEKLISAEARMRKSWADSFRKKRLLQNCIIYSITEFRGDVRSALAHRPQLTSPRTAHKGTEEKHKGGSPKDRVDFGKLAGFDPEIMTVREDKNGKGLCKQFQIGKCAFGQRCRFGHKCDVMMENGKACGAEGHNRIGHHAATGNKGKGRAARPADEEEEG